MIHLKIPYGEGYQEADLDADNIPVELVDPPLEPCRVPVEHLIADALDRPVGSPRLEELASASDQILILVNDQTRPGPNAQMCRAIVERLAKAGVPDGNITFMIATGSHKGPSPEQLSVILGGLEKRFRVLVHDCRAPDCALVGVTKTAGVPIYVNRAVAESDFIITTGLISPHHSAGFSGGRKSIVPGVASLKTLHTHHSLPIRPFEPSVGILDGNLFHAVACEAARMVSVRFILNVVQDIHKQIVAAVAGDLERAHEEGIRICREKNTVTVHGCGDLIITSPGGAPRDIDLWQSQKALSTAEMLCTPGNDNIFILVARGQGGLPQLFMDWMSAASCPQDVIDRFRREGFDVGTNKAFMYARCMQKGRIILVTEGLDARAAAEVNMSWAPDLQTAVDTALSEKAIRKITILPRAINLIPDIV